MQESNIETQEQQGIVAAIRKEAHNVLLVMKTKIHWVLAVMTVSMTMGASHAQSTTIEFDPDIFIAAINQWLPMSMSIQAIGVGIAGAFALAGVVGLMIVNAFRGRITG